MAGIAASVMNLESRFSEVSFVNFVKWITSWSPAHTAVTHEAVTRVVTSVEVTTTGGYAFSLTDADVEEVEGGEVGQLGQYVDGEPRRLCRWEGGEERGEGGEERVRGREESEAGEERVRGARTHWSSGVRSRTSMSERSRDRSLWKAWRPWSPAAERRHESRESDRSFVNGAIASRPASETSV